ncbi:lysozyme inhibitor LprI family protein [Methylobacterium indicum]|uniref:lysozyme inhibitor LprI family protein n=1 Tax=Methylobacterium indicum TaxID=1775910 RepID=UPI00243498EA|nr:lysozyme inhibitor LprI family protein [Methylobacterium indicum]
MQALDRTIIPRLLLATTILGASPALAAQPSFDCAKAASRIERTICASAPLAKADAALSAAYQEARRTLAPEAGALLLVDEKRFLAARERVFSTGDKDPAALLLGEIEDRIAFLRSLRVPPPGRLAGTWSNLFGTVTVTPGTDGGLAVKVDANEPITARWTCGAEGKGRLAGDLLTVSLGEDGSALTLAREGETLTLGAVPGKGEAEGTADYCGLNGSVDGTYFFVTPAAAAR